MNAETLTTVARAEDRRARIWDRFAPGYAKQPIKDMASYEKKLVMTREVLAPHMSVLELGCGTGGTALWHAAHVAHVRATDISPKMIGIAEEKARAVSAQNVTFEVAAADALEVRRESIDAVLALNFLHLVPDRSRVIADVRRWLKPGGVFVSSTMCMAELLPIYRIIVPLGRAVGYLPLVRFFTAQALTDSLVRGGFEVEQVWRPAEKAPLFVIARKPALSRDLCAPGAGG